VREQNHTARGNSGHSGDSGSADDIERAVIAIMIAARERKTRCPAQISQPIHRVIRPVDYRMIDSAAPTGALGAAHPWAGTPIAAAV
jgi:hypothetical protein